MIFWGISRLLISFWVILWISRKGNIILVNAVECTLLSISHECKLLILLISGHWKQWKWTRGCDNLLYERYFTQHSSSTLDYDLNFVNPLSFVKIWPALGGFPGSPVVKNLPASAADMGSVPGLGRFHVPQSNWAHVPQLLEIVCPRACAPQPEAMQWETRAPQ